MIIFFFLLLFVYKLQSYKYSKQKFIFLNISNRNIVTDIRLLIDSNSEEERENENEEAPAAAARMYTVEEIERARRIVQEYEFKMKQKYGYFSHGIEYLAANGRLPSENIYVELPVHNINELGHSELREITAEEYLENERRFGTWESRFLREQSETQERLSREPQRQESRRGENYLMRRMPQSNERGERITEYRPSTSFGSHGVDDSSLGAVGGVKPQLRSYPESSVSEEEEEETDFRDRRLESLVQASSLTEKHTKKNKKQKGGLLSHRKKRANQELPKQERVMQPQPVQEGELQEVSEPSEPVESGSHQTHLRESEHHYHPRNSERLSHSRRVSEFPLTSQERENLNERNHHYRHRHRDRSQLSDSRRVSEYPLTSENRERIQLQMAAMSINEGPFSANWIPQYEGREEESENIYEEISFVQREEEIGEMPRATESTTFNNPFLLYTSHQLSTLSGRDERRPNPHERHHHQSNNQNTRRQSDPLPPPPFEVYSPDLQHSRFTDRLSSNIPQNSENIPETTHERRGSNDSSRRGN